MTVIVIQLYTVCVYMCDVVRHFCHMCSLRMSDDLINILYLRNIY